jgi:hypothetical protein
VSYIAPIDTWTGFPNVFHPDWTDFLAVLFADAEAAKDDPWILGHFVDNELQWWGSPVWSCWSDTCMFNQVWSLPGTHSAKARWVQFLQEAIPNNFEATFAANWNISGISSASQLLSHTSPRNPSTAAGEAIAR